MKILYINLPYSGHVIPTVGLVQELIRARHRVTWLMPRDWERRRTPKPSQQGNWRKTQIR